MDYALWAVAVLALLVALKASMMAAAAGRDADSAHDRLKVVESSCRDAVTCSNLAENRSTTVDFLLIELAKTLGYKWTPGARTDSRWEKVGKR